MNALSVVHCRRSVDGASCQRAGAEAGAGPGTEAASAARGAEATGRVKGPFWPQPASTAKAPAAPTQIAPRMSPLAAERVATLEFSCIAGFY